MHKLVSKLKILSTESTIAVILLTVDNQPPTTEASIIVIFVKRGTALTYFLLYAMKLLFRIIFVLFIWFIQACSPLGNPVDKEVSDSFYFDKSEIDVIYSPMGNWFELEASKIGADVESFVVLNKQIAKDKNRVYYQSTYVNLPELDVSEFRAEQAYAMLNIGFDQKNVYLFTRDYTAKETAVKIIPGADSHTFKASDFEWAKDKNHYYYRFSPVDVDYESFTRVNERFHLDKEQAYYHTYDTFSAFQVDVATFKKLDEAYAYDQNSVYYFVEFIQDKAQNLLLRIPNPDSRTIKVIDKYHLRAGGKIYHRGFEITDADIGSFETISENYSKDRQHVYYNGVRLTDADPESFQYDDKTFYFKDKNRSYFQGKPVDETGNTQ